MSDYALLWIYALFKFCVVIIAAYAMYKIGEHYGRKAAEEKAKRQAAVKARMNGYRTSQRLYWVDAIRADKPKKKRKVVVKGAFADMDSVWK